MLELEKILKFRGSRWHDFNAEFHHDLQIITNFVFFRRLEMFDI
jgi:hypothetical protein